MTDIHGYVIVHKETGARWGSCYDSQTGAKTSWYGTFCRRSGWTSRELQHLKGKKFNEQTEYVIKPLIIWEQ